MLADLFQRGELVCQLQSEVALLVPAPTDNCAPDMLGKRWDHLRPGSRVDLSDIRWVEKPYR